MGLCFRLAEHLLTFAFRLPGTRRKSVDVMAEASVCGLRYVAVAVADLEIERIFYREVWGLEEVAHSGDVVYFATVSSSEPFVLRVRRSDTPRLDVIGFAASTRADVDAIYQRLEARGVKLIAAPHELSSPGGGYGFRFFDPDGHTLEISADVASRSGRSLGERESLPVTLSHVVLHASSLQASVAFYQQQLGFRVSDWLGDFMCFLRCSSQHHRIAFMPGPATLNHISFDVRDVNDLMRSVARLARAGTQLDWGPGRHTAGANMFAYYRTPNGVTVEYSAELEQVDDATWQATVYPLTPETTDQWGTGHLFASGTPHFPQQPDAGLWTPPPV